MIGGKPEQPWSDGQASLLLSCKRWPPRSAGWTTTAQAAHLEEAKIVRQAPVEALHGLARLEAHIEGVQHGPGNSLVSVHWPVHACSTGVHQTGAASLACSSNDQRSTRPITQGTLHCCAALRLLLEVWTPGGGHCHSPPGLLGSMLIAPAARCVQRACWPQGGAPASVRPIFSGQCTRWVLLAAVAESQVSLRQPAGGQSRRKRGGGGEKDSLPLTWPASCSLRDPCVASQRLGRPAMPHWQLLPRQHSMQAQARLVAHRPSVVMR